MFKEVKGMAKSQAQKDCESGASVRAALDAAKEARLEKRTASEFSELEKDIQNAYEGNVTIEEAERLAAKFLGAQMQVAAKLMKADLDARMKKSGLKAVKGTRYLEEAAKGEKKPSDVLIGAVLDTDKLVQ
jgi:hypothetical protein